MVEQKYIDITFAFITIFQTHKYIQIHAKLLLRFWIMFEILACNSHKNLRNSKKEPTNFFRSLSSQA